MINNVIIFAIIIFFNIYTHVNITKYNIIYYFIKPANVIIMYFCLCPSHTYTSLTRPFSYMIGTCLHEQLKALQIFLSASSG